MHSLEKSISQNIPQNAPIIVALSGGADSVALLLALHSLHINLYAAHINHNLRSAAISDQNFCIELCKRLDIPIKVYSAPVKQYAKSEGISIEEAGRFFRYRYLRQAMEDFAIPTAQIATGHHQNDNAETILLNLARGTGLKGLCGIPPNNGNIIRPLINITRAEIEKYLSYKNQPYVTDATNAQNVFTRNRIRNQILPELAKINPRIVQNMSKNAALLRDEENFMAAEAAKIYESVSVASCQSQIVLDTIELEKAHPAIQRRVIYIALQNVGLVNITSTHLHTVLQLLPSKSGKRVCIQNIVAQKQYSAITIQQNAHEKAPHYSLAVPSCTFLPELNANIELSFVSFDKKNVILHCTKLFEYDMVVGSLTLRTRQAGDSIVLKSAQGNFTKKLQNYFTDQKLPQQKRDSILLLANGSNILWVMDDKNPTSAIFSHRQKYSNPLWVTIWSDAND